MSIHELQIKRIPRDRIQSKQPQPNDELLRLTNAMRAVLRRNFPDPFERQIVVSQIMQQVKAG